MTENRSDQLLDRVGAVAGIAAAFLLLALFTVFPTIPAPNRTIGAIASKAAGNTTGLLLGAYAGALLTGTLLVFGACVAARLRRAEGPGGWWLVAAIGIAGTAIGITGNTLEIMFVRAVDHGASGAALWIGYGGDHWVSTLVAIPLAVFLLAVGLGTQATGALPRRLGRVSLVLAALFVVGAASVTGDEVDGGVLGVVLLLAYLGLFVWIVLTSVTVLRGADSGRVQAAAAVE